MKMIVKRVLNFIAIVATFVESFNLDVDNPIITFGELNSYFGYSLATHKYNNESRLLIGAPRENHQSVQFSGALHQCQINKRSFQCSKIVLSQKFYEKNQWLGATVASANGKALVCAPRKGSRAQGECYYSYDNLSKFFPFNPITNDYCEIGFSAAFSSNGDTLFTGGPSCTDNAGRLFRNYGNLVDCSGNYPERSCKMVGSDLAFFSYSMAVGNILNGQEGIATSVGFHKDSAFAGKVNFFDKNELKRYGFLDGYQPGEQFGASLSIGDVNGDGRDDILVGAPHHTDYADSQLKHEIGAVYVYYQTPQGRFQRGKPNELILKGRSAGGRFGAAVAVLGDSNLDGFRDVAVGAPYNEEGKVYIFHGSATGLRERPSQIISGKSFSPPIETFGFSLGGVVDMDGNGYSDLAVGAYRSSAVVYLPARPTIEMISGLSFVPEHISLENKTCNLPDLDRDLPVSVSCTTLQYCFVYKGKDVSTTVSLEVTILLDVKKSKGSKRLFFLDYGDSKFTEDVVLTLGQTFCLKKLTYVRPDIRDKLSPIEAEMAIKLISDNRPGFPVFDISTKTNITSTLSIFKDCGKDSICYPDLQLQSQM